MFRRIVLLVMLSFGLTGCAYLGSVSTSSVPVDRSKIVEVESSRFIFLLLNFDNDYVNDIARDLADQCRDGTVKGVLTKHEKITYFPIIAHGVRVTATGYCVNQEAEK